MSEPEPRRVHHVGLEITLNGQPIDVTGMELPLDCLPRFAPPFGIRSFSFSRQMAADDLERLRAFFDGSRFAPTPADASMLRSLGIQP